MLIPREQPVLEGLNSFYLHLEKLIEHMQGDIGSGGIHCKSPNLEMLVYFNEQEIISSLIQEKGGPAHFAPSNTIAVNLFSSTNLAVQVYQLDAHAIFYWAQMPLFQRAKSSLRSTEIALPDLIFRLKQKRFSGFIDVHLVKRSESGILFFHEGERIGGSYSWGRGGMTTSHDDYHLLLNWIQANEGVFSFGSFLKEEKPVSSEAPDSHG